MKKKLVKVLAIACSLTCIATAGLGATLSKAPELAVAKAYEITLSDENAVKSDYAYGDVLSIPMGTIDGEPTTKFILLSPTGKVYDTASVSLQEEGQYTIVWYATVGGKEVSASKSFFVTKSAFTIDGGGTYTYMESLERANAEDGIKVSLDMESTFRYNRAIDLTDTSVPLARLFPYQRVDNVEGQYNEYTEKSNAIKAQLKAEGWTDSDKISEEVQRQLGTATTYFQYTNDARNYLITLTDRYDPTNYVTIDLEWKESNRYFNFRANAVGQTAHGFRSTTEKSIQENNTSWDEIVDYDGDLYKIFYAPDNGLTQCNKTDDKGLELYYDVETNRIYMTYYVYKPVDSNKDGDYDDDIASGYTLYEKALFADLSNTKIYPKNPFKGFTTGEVYFSISAKNYVNSTANIDIASIGGISGRDLLDADMHDTKAPVIKVDEALSKGSPFIAVNEEIEVPSATAYDLNLPYGTKATTAVYYAYNPNSDKNVSVGLVDGKFTPKKAGAYTIVYTATDPSGNVGTATVDLQCRTSVDNKAVKLTVDEGLEALAGTALQIPECTVSGLYSDASALKTYVQFEEGEKSLLTGDSLFVRGVGRYVITYAYETPFKTYTATCTVTSSASENVTFSASVLPEYFIKDAKYTVDPVYAYEYTAKEPVEVEAKVFMSADGGSFVEVNRKETLISASSTVQFKYEHKGAVAYSDVVKVVDVGYGGTIQAEKYFYSENNAFVGDATGSGIRYFANGTTSSATMKYINMLSLSEFGFDFRFLPSIKDDARAFVAPSSLTLTLVDYYDRNNKATASFVAKGAQTEFYVNGEHKTTLANALLNNFFSVTYAKGFRIDNKSYAWDGAFTSDRILLWVTLNGIEGDTCLEVTSLGIDTWVKRTTDKTKPVVSYSELNAGYQSLNKVITVAQPYAYDLLSPYVESALSLTVTCPDGSFATSEDGVKLDGTCSINREYKLKLSMQGTYLIKYTYKDQKGNEYVYIDRPEVQDQTSPVITIDGVTANEVLSATQNTNVTVATYTATDDTTASDILNSWVCVFFPSGECKQLENGGTFYASEKGKYTVFYEAFDEVGNYTTLRYFVVVS